MQSSHEKSHARAQLKSIVAAIDESARREKSRNACSLLTSTAEFRAAQVVMLFLSMPAEIDTTCIALKCWQEGKTVVVPRVAWDQRRMMPIEISSLTTDVADVEHGPRGVKLREPVSGKPVPVNLIDLVLVPGLGYTKDGYRIGRGMGFYDRFLAQPDFLGLSVGYAYEEQVLESIPTQDHDVPVSMLVTDQSIRRFATNCMSGGATPR
jgi:5-formyltetrahydrofolate cyclo-ligase